MRSDSKSTSPIGPLSPLISDIRDWQIKKAPRENWRVAKVLGVTMALQANCVWHSAND